MSFRLRLVHVAAVLLPFLLVGCVGEGERPVGQVETGQEPNRIAPMEEDSEPVWVEVERFQVSTAESSEPFVANGLIRVRYDFDFEKDPMLALGSLSLHEYNGELCRQSKQIESTWIGNSLDPTQEINFGYFQGTVCVNLHLTDPNWNKGTVYVTIETQI